MFAFRKMRRVTAACLAALIGAIGCLGAFALFEGIVWPHADGDRVREKGSLTLDVSNAADGYVMARCDETSSRMKLRMEKGGSTYTYDLNGAGDYEIFPLQMGSGSYTCTLFKNVTGNKYSKEAEVSFDVELNNKNAAYLCPSQYVYYTEDSPAVKMSEEICAGLETDIEKVRAIRDFMVDGFIYDFVRAATTKSFYLGDVDGCFDTRMGLCQDIAVVAACMLRVQGIPTQLVIGYANNIYHAWNNVLIDGEYKRLDITLEIGGIAKNCVYTPERYY